jgi:hypothetical protein
MWKPRRLTTLWASTVCYSDSFTFFIGPTLPNRFYITAMSAAQLTMHRIVGWWWIMIQIGCEREQSWSRLKYYPSICMERLRKPKKYVRIGVFGVLAASWVQLLLLQAIFFAFVYNTLLLYLHFEIHVSNCIWVFIERDSSCWWIWLKFKCWQHDFAYIYRIKCDRNPSWKSQKPHLLEWTESLINGLALKNKEHTVRLNSTEFVQPIAPFITGDCGRAVQCSAEEATMRCNKTEDLRINFLTLISWH